MYDYLQIGKIVNTHGVMGEVKIIPLTDDPTRFKKLKWVYIDKNNSLEKFNIKGVKFLKNFVIIKFEGIDDADTAAKLKELFMLVDREHAVSLPEDSFFICDIIGSKVFDESDTLLGELINVLQTGSNDVYVVKDATNREILIPALKSVVKSVSVKDGRIIVALPEGLL